MPAAARLQTADAAKIPLPAYSPKHHLDEHALIDLDQKFFNDAAARVCLEKG